MRFTRWRKSMPQVKCRKSWFNPSRIARPALRYRRIVIVRLSGSLTRVEIGHLRSGSAGNGRVNSQGSGWSLSERTESPRLENQQHATLALRYIGRVPKFGPLN
jgi:hypothetical protein